MDMLEGVGRRSGTDKLLELGQYTLNGYERNGLFRNNGDGTFSDVGWLHGVDRVSAKSRDAPFWFSWSPQGCGGFLCSVAAPSL